MCHILLKEIYTSLLLWEIKCNAVFFFLIQLGLIHMEIMTFDPDNPSKTAM